MQSKIGSEQINTFIGGMNPDVDVSSSKANTYIHAENIRISPDSTSSFGAMSPMEDEIINTSNAFEEAKIVHSDSVRDIAVVFTTDSSYTYVYRISKSGESLVSKKILKVDYVVQDKLSTVIRYEDDDNIRLYWTDGTSQIKSYNVAPSNDKLTLSVTSESSINIIPASNLSSPIISEITSGKLNRGRIQYVYRGTNESGSSSVLSSASKIVDLKEEGSNEILLVDDVQPNSGLGVKLKINKTELTGFNRVKLYSIYYDNYSSLPKISLVLDAKVLDIAGAQLIFNDYGTSALQELTIEEFAQIGNSFFSAKYIDSKDNMLFAANISDLEFNVDYDTRAYQFSETEYEGSELVDGGYSFEFTTTGSYCDDAIYVTPEQGLYLSEIIKEWDIFTTVGGDNTYLIVDSVDDSNFKITFRGGSIFPFYTEGDLIVISEGSVITYRKAVVYESDDSNTMIPSYNIQPLPENHDCIHKEIYEEERWSDLEYTRNKDGVLGGSGPNVSYKYVNTYLIGAKEGARVSDYDYDLANKFIDDRIVRLGANESTIDSLLINKSDGTLEYQGVSEFGIDAHAGKLDYSNRLLSGALQSYKRDEIYRFGAVFYSKDGRKTDVKWIADIRFPAGYFEDAANKWTSSMFEMPEDFLANYDVNSTIKNRLDKQELLVKPLGIEFEFSNLDTIPDVAKIEIVRCKRDVNNRTIYTQGVLQKIGIFTNPNKGTELYNDIKYYDINNQNTLRPHSIISMGESYGVAPLITDTTTTSGFPDTYTLGFNEFYNTVGGTKMGDLLYGDSASITMSPYHSARTNKMLISPEVSYYGEDFTIQLARIPSKYLSIERVVSPKVTPATIQYSLSGGTSVAYVGSNLHSNLRFEYESELWPSAMYAGADLTEDLLATSYRDSMFFSLGLAGMDIANSVTSENTGTDIAENDYNEKTYDLNLSAVFSEDYSFKVLLSGVGLLSRVNFSDSPQLWLNGYAYKSGFPGCDILNTSGTTTSKPIYAELADDLFDCGYPSLTFKFYSSLNTRDTNLAANDSYITELRTITRSTNDITSYAISYNQSAGSMPTFSVLESSYAGQTSSAIAHQDYINSTSIGGTLFYNFSKSLSSQIPHAISGKADVIDTRIMYTSGDQDKISATNLASLINRSKISGLHGAGLLINTENEIPSIFSIDESMRKYNSGSLNSRFSALESKIRAGLSTYIVDIKANNIGIYGGPSYQDRQFSEYISTGYYISNDSNIESKTVFGGDTFISMFEYTITSANDQTKVGSEAMMSKNNWWNDVVLSQSVRTAAIIPLETGINVFNDDGVSFTDSNNIVLQADAGVYSPGASHGVKYSRAQQKDQYNYDSVFSSDATAIGFLSGILNEEQYNKYDCRIVNSEKKTNDELDDSWAIFKPSNYIDVDTKFGEITRIVSHFNKLYYFQEDGVGVVSVNERSLITSNDGSDLALGTGGTLTRYDYISTTAGLSKNTIKGLLSTESGIYWTDKDRNSMFRIAGDGIDQVSRTKGIQSDLNKNTDTFGTRSLIWKNKKHAEIVFSNLLIPNRESFGLMSDESEVLETDDEKIITT